MLIAAELCLFSPRICSAADNQPLRAATVTVDDFGNVILCGYSLIVNTNLSAIEYSSPAIPLWTNYYNSTMAAFPTSDLSDNAANLYTTADTLTVAYTSVGIPLWTNHSFGVTAVNSYGRSVHLRAGNALFAYTSLGTPIWTNYSFEGNIVVDMRRDGALYLTHSNALFAYTGGGGPLWTNVSVGGNVAVDDQNGNVYAAGNTAGANTPVDYAIAAFTSNGVPLWKSQFDGSTISRGNPTGIAADPANGNVYVSGVLVDTNVFSHFAAVAYTSKGIPIWTNHCIGKSPAFYQSAEQPMSTNDVPSTNSNTFSPSTNLYYTTISDVVEVDKNADFYVAGISYESYTAYSLPSPIPLLFQPMKGRFVLSWSNALFQLQSAPSLSGEFTNVVGATSPWTNVIDGKGKFFRLRYP